MLDSSSRRWDDRAYGLVSLYDMLNVNAERFIEAGEILCGIDRKFSGFLIGSASLISQDQLIWLREELTRLTNDCKYLNLYTTGRLVEVFCETYKHVTPSIQQTKDGMTGILQSFKAEAGTQMFMYLLPHRVKYWTDMSMIDKPEVWMGDEISELLTILGDPFSNAKADAIEAGNSIAFERFTAAVYHLMRASEYGLISVASALQVEPKVFAQGWDKILIGINGKIKAFSSSGLPNWKEEEQFFSNLSSWFTTIKNGWRNPVSHIPRVYHERTACAMFGATKELFEYLKIRGFKQPESMPESILLPEE